MKKIIMGVSVLVIFLLSLTLVLAGQDKNMTKDGKDCKKISVYKAKWYGLKVIGFVIISFVFSGIFWWTKILVDRKFGKKKKK